MGTENFAARVESVLVGENPNSLITTPVKQIEFDLEGVVGDTHRGFTRKLDIRDRILLGDRSLQKGVGVRNWRQWSAVSREDLTTIADILEVDHVEPTWLGANLCLSGIERFSKLPRGTTLHFTGGVILMVEEENTPCITPGKEIAKYYPEVNPSEFVEAAMGFRGLVGVVHKAGLVGEGELVTVKVYLPAPKVDNKWE